MQTPRAGPAIVSVLIAALFLGQRASGQGQSLIFSKVVDSSAIAPGGSTTFSEFADPVISHGNIGFIAGRVPKFFDPSAGVFQVNPNGTVSNIADRNTLYPGGPGRFINFYNASIDHGEMSFEGFGEPPENYFYVYGVFLHNSVGLHPVIQSFGSNHGGYDNRVSDGEVAYGWPNGIVATRGGGTVEIVTSGQTLPDGVVINTRSFDYRSGEAVYIATVNTDQKTNLYRWNGESSQLVLDGNTPVPRGGGVTFKVQKPREVAFDGDVVAFGTKPDNTQSPFGWGVYKKVGSSVNVVADNFTAAPGGGGNFRFVQSVAADSGNIAFVGTPETGTPGLYLDRNNVIERVARVGDVLDGKSVASIGFAGRGALSGRSLTFQVSFTDNTQAIYRSDLAPIAPQLPVYRALPSRTKARGLILIVHGWKSGPKEWPSSMAQQIAQDLVDAGNRADWDIVTYDWQDAAMANSPEVARAKGMMLGAAVGKNISLLGYEKVQLIGHSAGSWLIDEAANQVRSATSSTTIHSTFLDAYVPLGVGSRILGDKSDWAEQYVDTRTLPNPLFSMLDPTKSRLHRAYNINVTDLDGSGSSDPGDWHAWPHNWYFDTTQSPHGSLSHGWGFARTPEFEGSPNHSQYPRGDSLHLSGSRGGGDGGDLPDPTFLSPIDFGVLTHNTSNTGTVEIAGTHETLRSTTNVWSMHLVPVPDGELTLIRFDADFLSGNDSHATRSVTWDGLEMAFLDERYVTVGLQEYVFALPNNYDVGLYSLAFRLDQFGTGEGAIAISNVSLGYIPEPTMISITLVVFISSVLVKRHTNHRRNQHEQDDSIKQHGDADICPDCLVGAASE